MIYSDNLVVNNRLEKIALLRDFLQFASLEITKRANNKQIPDIVGGIKILNLLAEQYVDLTER